MGRENLLTPLFVELRFSFGISLPALTLLSYFVGYQHVQVDQNASCKRDFCVTAM